MGTRWYASLCSIRRPCLFSLAFSFDNLAATAFSLLPRIGSSSLMVTRLPGLLYILPITSSYLVGVFFALRFCLSSAMISLSVLLLIEESIWLPWFDSNILRSVWPNFLFAILAINSGSSARLSKNSRTFSSTDCGDCCSELILSDKVAYDNRGFYYLSNCQFLYPEVMINYFDELQKLFFRGDSAGEAKLWGGG